jgi:hypothetical protein
MTNKKFVKQITAIWHEWNKNTNGANKEDLPLKMFITRHTRRAKKRGREQEIQTTIKTFLPFYRK